MVESALGRTTPGHQFTNSVMAGISGGLVALLLQWWTNAIDYPLNISGKPLFSLPANIPVTFELIVLFSAFATFGGVDTDRRRKRLAGGSASRIFAEATTICRREVKMVRQPSLETGSRPMLPK